MELEFGSVGFLGEGETGVPEEKTHKTKKKLHRHKQWRRFGI